MSRYRVWVVDDDQSIRWVLQRAFQRVSIDIECFESADEAHTALQQYARLPDTIISDVKMTGMDGLEFLNALHREKPQIPVIIMTAHADLDTAVSAYEGGAFEYIPKPFDVNEVIATTRRACGSVIEGSDKIDRPPRETSGLIGETPAMQNVFRAIGKLSRSHVTVLINGESGTGKELIARALHRHSPRADKPFVALNMAAIPAELMEAELFGHEKGAFTGATEKRHGRFEQADGGTLFLDEIGDMPADLQTRLLRVLSENQFYSIGGKQAINVDVRIIAATHQNLDQLVADKRFREDLFHRLNVIRITAPALHERRDDIPALLKAFLTNAAAELGTATKTADEQLNEHLKSLKWPGNVRQLENLAHWLTVMTTAPRLTVDDLPSDLSASDSTAVSTAQDWTDALYQWAIENMEGNRQDVGTKATEMFERTLIRSAMASKNNHKQNAALALGWGRNTLTRKLKEYDLKLEK